MTQTTPPLSAACVRAWARCVRAGLACAVVCCTALALASPPLLDLALARESDLDGLQGLGPATTRRILQERAQQPFANWADLQRRVPGIQHKKSLQLSAQGLRIQGLPYATSYAPPASQ